jgi:hypothetical protein
LQKTLALEQPNIDAELDWKNVEWLNQNYLSRDRPRRTSQGALKIIARRGDNGNKALALREGDAQTFKTN